MRTPITRISQAEPPLPTPAPAPPMPDPMAGGLGAPPMPDPMAGGLGAPAMGAPASPTISTAPKSSLYAIENSGMLLMDAEIEKRLKEQFASTENIGTTSEQEIANEIWLEYGGNELGGVDKEKAGKRLPDKEVDLNEVKRTRDRKWERLLIGKNLSDLGITLEDLTDMVVSLSQGIAAIAKKSAGGGAPAMASFKLDSFVKIAQILYFQSNKQ